MCILIPYEIKNVFKQEKENITSNGALIAKPFSFLTILPATSCSFHFILLDWFKKAKLRH